MGSQRILRTISENVKWWHSESSKFHKAVSTIWINSENNDLNYGEEIKRKRWRQRRKVDSKSTAEKFHLRSWWQTVLFEELLSFSNVDSVFYNFNKKCQNTSNVLLKPILLSDPTTVHQLHMHIRLSFQINFYQTQCSTRHSRNTLLETLGSSRTHHSKCNRTSASPSPVLRSTPSQRLHLFAYTENTWLPSGSDQPTRQTPASSVKSLLPSLPFSAISTCRCAARIPTWPRLLTLLRVFTKTVVVNEYKLLNNIKKKNTSTMREWKDD